MTSQKKTRLRVIPLGGLDEIGKNMTVFEYGQDMVVVDANHPLAGKRLHFDVEIMDVRDATEEELAQVEELLVSLQKVMNESR